MTRPEWLSVGFKLMGVYFGVSGVSTVWGALLVMMATSGHGAPTEAVGAFGMLMPAVHLAAAFLLIRRTDACLRWCGEGGS